MAACPDPLTETLPRFEGEDKAAGLHNVGDDACDLSDFTHRKSWPSPVFNLGVRCLSAKFPFYAVRKNRHPAKPKVVDSRKKAKKTA